MAAAPLAPARTEADVPARDEDAPRTPAGFGRAQDGTLAPAPDALADRGAVPAAPRPPRDDAFVRPATAPAANPLWAWFTGGNVLTRIGVIALFFGIGFLLKYLAEFVTVPLEAKLLGVALVGVALVVLGVRLSGNRARLRAVARGRRCRHPVPDDVRRIQALRRAPPLPAFALLVAVSVLTVGLAVRADSQPLAGLAIAGGFLAPFLVATSGGPPARLFGYFAVLNAAIFALAWVRAWRALNVLGFVFTFALGLFWGAQYYDPAHFATVEPFLVLFFLFYVAIAILYAKRGPFAAKAPVDALLVFGVPLVGFALQSALVEDTRYGVAWSAIAVAALYGVLAAGLWRRAEEGLALLARAFLVLAIIFATIAIPYACDARWTSAWWALEAAGVYWIGCRQRQPLARGFALLLQVGAAAAFIVGNVDAEGPLFLNASFAGTTLIALAGFATAFVADRHRDAISPHERLVAPLLLLWAGAWWYAGGAIEIDRVLPERSEGNAFLAFAVGSVALALALRRWLRWSRLAWFGVALLPLMALVAFADWDRMRTTLTAYGWVVWPLAWLLHWRVLHAADALRSGEALADAPPGPARRFLAFAHSASAISLVAWLAWEASEWVGRAFPEGTVWMPSAAAWPAIAYLVLIARGAHVQRWPFADYRDAYAASAATTIAALLAVWYALVNVISPGGTEPLPYLPLANPLDLTLLATLAALFAWARDTARVAERTLYAWFGVAVFVARQRAGVPRGPPVARRAVAPVVPAGVEAAAGHAHAHVVGHRAAIDAARDAALDPAAVDGGGGAPRRRRDQALRARPGCAVRIAADRRVPRCGRAAAADRLPGAAAAGAGGRGEAARGDEVRGATPCPMQDSRS